MFSLLVPVYLLINSPSKKVLSCDYSSYPSEYSVEHPWQVDQIDLEKAWKICTGSQSVKVGIIDSGIDGNHIDLVDNVDSSLSYSFNTGFNTGLEDFVGHGTHVAGIVGAKGDNGIGVSGVCWNTNIVSLRVANSTNGNIDPSLVDDAISYAELNQIPIINLSFRSFIEYPGWYESILNYNGLIVCSAGNDSINVDYSQYNNVYPACYSRPNIIAVGNSTALDSRAENSNYGSTSVDLFAPGVDIYSTMPNDDYGNESGTSMSSPMVAGVAALLLSIDPSLSIIQLRNAILNNVDVISNLSGLCTTGGRLNAYNSALSIIPIIPEQSTPVSHAANVNYSRIVRLECDNAHYTYSFSGPSNYRVTMYTDIEMAPLFSSVFTDSLVHTVSFSSREEKTIFVKIDNLSNTSGTFNSNISNVSLHNYTTIRPFNSTHHRCICSCGAFELRPHIYQGGSNNCILCSLNPKNDFNAELSEDLLLLEYH